MSVDYLALLKQNAGIPLVGELPKLPKAPYGSKDSAHTNAHAQNEGATPVYERDTTTDNEEAKSQTVVCAVTAKTAKRVSEQIQSPGNVSMTEDETSAIRAWLELIGETDPATIADVLSACERLPETRARCLREARTTEARQVIATRAALEAAEEHGALLSEDRTRSEAERVAKLAELFYNHLFGPGMATRCCWAPGDRYCNAGKRFRDIYYEAAKAAGRLL